jgi:hypothetical protein
MPTSATTAPTLSSRALNRATLARQSLLARSDVSALATIRHLVGLQAQAPFPPYFGLWSRLVAFDPDELVGLIERREAVRIVAMRSTVHLLSADDATALRILLRPALDRMFRSSAFGKELAGAHDVDGLIAAGRELMDEAPRTGQDLAALLGPAWPELSAATIQNALRTRLALVQVPPRGLWGRSGRPTLTTIEAWLGHPLATEVTVDDVVMRYLGAFGPASVADVQAWSGLTRLGEVVDRLGPSLRRFTGPTGAALFDLPDAPRPDEDTPAPVRLIAEFDNLTIGYADRTRVIAEDDRRRAYSVNGIVPGLVLVDGVTEGVWRLQRSGDRTIVAISAFRPIGARDRAEIGAEALALAAFAAPGTATEVTFT